MPLPPAMPALCSNLPEPLVLNNLDWFGGMGLLTFLRDIGAAQLCLSSHLQARLYSCLL